MVTHVTVFYTDNAGNNALANVILAQSYVRKDFVADWKYALAAAKALPIGKWTVGDIYGILEDMGWSMTSLHCEEVSY